MQHRVYIHIKFNFCLQKSNQSNTVTSSLSNYVISSVDQGRFPSTKLFYILNDTGNECTNYKWLCGNQSRINDSRNRPWSTMYRNWSDACLVTQKEQIINLHEGIDWLNQSRIASKTISLILQLNCQIQSHVMTSFKYTNNYQTRNYNGFTIAQDHIKTNCRH